MERYQELMWREYKKTRPTKYLQFMLFTFSQNASTKNFSSHNISVYVMTNLITYIDYHDLAGLFILTIHLFLLTQMPSQFFIVHQTIIELLFIWIVFLTKEGKITQTVTKLVNWYKSTSHHFLKIIRKCPGRCFSQG